MIHWTDSAKEELSRYLQRQSNLRNPADPDVENLVQQIRLHALEEATRRQSRHVTDEILRHILARIAAPGESAPRAAISRPKASSSLWRQTQPKDASPGALIFFGILLPLITLAIEVATEFCAGIFFDPLPTVAHLAMVAGVPFANFCTWRAMRRGGLAAKPSRLLFLAGAAAGSSLFYALWYLPLLPFALIGTILYGIGLLPLTPLLAFVVSWKWQKRLAAEANQSHGNLLGFAFGFGFLLLLSVPFFISNIGLRMAASESEEHSARGVRFLQIFGSESELLRASHPDPEGWAMIKSSFLPRIASGPTIDEAREIFFRVTGESFSSRSQPRTKGSFRDRETGGRTVGSTIEGLSLVSSRLEGTADPLSATSYLEWTFVFKNNTSALQEARTEIALPAGGVVSRLTLWIDGVPQEAAFGGRSQTTAAYQAVVNQRRDPVLVTTSGRDRILMQCFPVPRGGGEMKARLGITAPLSVRRNVTGSVRLPYLLEQNFASGGPHVVQFNGAVSEMSGMQLADPARNSIEVPGLAAAPVWVRDPLSTDGSAILQTLRPQLQPAPTRLMIVVDASRAMEEHRAEIVRALRSLPANVAPTILLAAGEVREINLDELAQTRLSGGYDNLPALARGFSLAERDPSSALLWLHGPQPFLTDEAERYLQEIAGKSGLFIDAATANGIDLLARKFEEHGIAPLPLPRSGAFGDDLQSLFQEWRTEEWKRVAFVRERLQVVPGNAVPLAGDPAAALLRLWAFDEIHRLGKDGRPAQLSEATELATRYRLVTPVSGAVVLESKRQYDDAGLDPNTTSAAESIPEPSTIVLAAVGLAMFALCGKRSRAFLCKSRG